MEDNETTYAQLYERVQKTIDALKTAKPENFEGKEHAEVVIKLPSRELKFNGITYLQKFGESFPRVVMKTECLLTMLTSRPAQFLVSRGNGLRYPEERGRARWEDGFSRLGMKIGGSATRVVASTSMEIASLMLCFGGKRCICVRTTKTFFGSIISYNEVLPFPSGMHCTILKSAI